MLEGLKMLGAPDDVLRVVQKNIDADRESQTFSVWQDNWPIFELFAHRLAGQWRYLISPLEGPIRLGLDYAAVEAVLRLSRLRKRQRRKIFALLCEMEAAVLAVDAGRRDKLNLKRGAAALQE